MPFCRNCGIEVSAKMVYCSNCGATLVTPKASPVKTSEVRDDTSPISSGDEQAVPPEIMGWNWGAFLLWWIWGIGNNTYVAFLTLIPFLGWFIMPFVLGVKGNEWAWKNKRWESVGHFRAVQKQWAMGGLILVIITGVIYAVIALS